MSGDDAGARKLAAARAALAEVRDGMRLGLGSGSTASAWTRLLGEALSDGRLRGIVGVPTSEATAALAREVGVPLTDLPADGVDLAVDGMDEVDDALRAVKGLGGALLREKVVAEAAGRFVLIGDAAKRVARLGERGPVPVEVLAFGWRHTAARLEALGLAPVLRGGEAAPVRSDNGNPLLDCAGAAGTDPTALAAALDRLPGVVGHGLFLGVAHAAYLAGADGVDRLERGA